MNQVGKIFSKREANTAEYYHALAERIKAANANDPRVQRLEGLTEREARFIAREIREGVMIPALSNSLIGTARGMATSGAAQQGMDAWMTPFNLTEQASRRALGLAAYRLEFAKQLEILRANGIAETTENLDKIESLARARAVEAIDNTLGEYSVLNRPAFWRTGLQSFLFMFKVFPTMSIQLLSRMDKQGQAAMVGSLMFMGGVSALPFAEDLEDIIDTIGQALGWKKGALRYEAAKMIDAVVPGASRILLSGVANELFPGNLATRIALGDFIPGTGILLAGADVGRELTEIGGPAPAAIIGMARFLTDIARLPTARMTAVDALRDSPVTMMRAVGDAYTYFQNGAIVDRRGYVVSPDAGAGAIIARVLGFYPVSAAREYDVIRLAKRMTDYQRDVTAGFRQAWIKARLTKDRAQERAVVDAVNDWNRGTKGTALEIRNFMAGNMRALREAQQPARERLRKGAPRAARPDIETMSDLIGN
jgi:hypothetical protein